MNMPEFEIDLHMRDSDLEGYIRLMDDNQLSELENFVRNEINKRFYARLWSGQSRHRLSKNTRRVEA